LPAGGRARAAHREAASRSGGSPGDRRRGGGAGVLLSAPRRLAAAGFAVAFALLPQAALAHAQLVQSDPPANATLQALPAAVTLVFTEPVTPAGAGVRVYSPSGEQVAATVEARGSVMTAPLSS